MRRGGIRGVFMAVPACLVGIAGAFAQQAPAQQPQRRPPPPGMARGAPADFRLTLEQRALDLLKAASAKLAAAKSMSFTATVGYEFPSRLGPPLVYTVRYDVAMQRPNLLKIVTPGDGPASEFVFDGKEMAAFAPADGLLAVAAAPPTIDGALKAAFETAAIYYPFTDLLLEDPYAALTQGANLAFRIGTSSVVGGVQTEMVAWANKEVFLQIWIGVDDKLPRRIRAIYSADRLRLRHDMELSNWQIDPASPPNVARSAAAASAQRIAFAKPAAPPPPGRPARRP